MSPLFWIWAGWRDRGRPSPRPAGLPARIPASWWARYALHKGKRKVTPKPPKPNSYANAMHGMIFCASDSLNALRAPRWRPVALTADPSYAEWSSEHVIAAFKLQGRRVYSWCDCSGTPPAKAIAMMIRNELDGWIGQGEDSNQLDAALRAGAVYIIGNPGAWTDAQRAHVREWALAGRLAILAEVYWPNPGYTSYGVPIACMVFGVAMDDGVRYPLSTYLRVIPSQWDDGYGVWHAGGLLEEDWAVMR